MFATASPIVIPAEGIYFVGLDFLRFLGADLVAVVVDLRRVVVFLFLAAMISPCVRIHGGSYYRWLFSRFLPPFLQNGVHDIGTV